MKPPHDEAELLTRAQAIAGLSVGQLAQRYKQRVPENLLRAKGWLGQLLEIALGATAGVKSEPDFQKLGIELKTIPVNAQGKPCETTYIGTVPMLNIAGLTWRESHVYKKLAHVLWIPFQADNAVAISKRRIGMPLLWRPSPTQEATLRQDWEELMELISLGKVENITARYGTYLQIRPKAADSNAIRDAIGNHGQCIKTLPRGFYLRTLFTAQILKQNYLSIS